MAQFKKRIDIIKEKVNSSGDYNILYPTTVCDAVLDLSTKYLPLTGGTITGSIVSASSSVNLGSSSASFNAIYGYSIYCKGVFADTYISTPYVKVSTAKGLQYYNGTSTWTYTLPAKTGTMALTSDIPTIDTSLSSTSTNPVQNKAVYSVLNKSYVYGMSVSGSTLTYNLRNVVTGGTSSSSVTLPSGSSGVSSTNSSAKLFLIGTTSQGTNLTSYSGSNIYISNNSILYTPTVSIADRISFTDLGYSSIREYSGGTGKCLSLNWEGDSGYSLQIGNNGITIDEGVPGDESYYLSNLLKINTSGINFGTSTNGDYFRINLSEGKPRIKFKTYSYVSDGFYVGELYGGSFGIMQIQLVPFPRNNNMGISHNFSNSLTLYVGTSSSQDTAPSSWTSISTFQDDIIQYSNSQGGYANGNSNNNLSFHRIGGDNGNSFTTSINARNRYIWFKLSNPDYRVAILPFLSEV